MRNEDRTSAEEETLRARLSRLIAAILRISEDLDLGVVLQEVVDSARSLTDASYGAVTIFDDAGVVQDFLISGMTSEERQELFSYPGGRALFAHLNGLREPLRTQDFVGHVAAAGFPRFPLRIGSVIAVPIVVRDRCVGVIYIGREEAGREFTRDDEETLEVLASHAAMAITNARRYGEEQLAKADLKALIDTSPVGVLVFDAQTRNAIAVNYEARRIFGIPPEHADNPTPLLRQLTYRRMDGSEVPRNDLGVRRSSRTGESVRAEELVIERLDGSCVTTLVNATPIRSEDGEITVARGHRPGHHAPGGLGEAAGRVPGHGEPRIEGPAGLDQGFGRHRARRLLRTRSR